MPHTKSAKKRMRQTAERRTRNRSQRSDMKTWIRKVGEAVAAGGAGAAETLSKAIQKIDKAAKNRVIHPNAAARYKSALARSVNAAPKA